MSCPQAAIEQLQAQLAAAYQEQEDIKAEARSAYEEQVQLVRLAQRQVEAAEDERAGHTQEIAMLQVRMPFADCAEHVHLILALPAPATADFSASSW